LCPSCAICDVRYRYEHWGIEAGSKSLWVVGDLFCV
jgi:hypothetical protein